MWLLVCVCVCVCVCLRGGWSSLKMKLFCRIISMHFKVFSSVKVQNGTILLGGGGGSATKISNILELCLIFLVDVGSKPT